MTNVTTSDAEKPFRPAPGEGPGETRIDAAVAAGGAAGLEAPPAGSA